MRKPCNALVKLLLAGLSSLAGLYASAHATESAGAWPVAPSTLHLPSPFGTLHVGINEYLYESTLLVDGKIVDPEVRGILNITYAFQMPDSQAALVSINSGSDSCPMAYRWILLEKNGHRLSPEFGSCSDKIRVSAIGGILRVETPHKADAAKIDVYSYDGARVRQKTISN